MLFLLKPFFFFNFISSFFYSSSSFSPSLLFFWELEMKSLALYILSMVTCRDTFDPDALKQCSHGVHMPLNSVYHLDSPQMLAPPFLVSFVLIYKHLSLGGNKSLCFLFLSFLFLSIPFLPPFLSSSFPSIFPSFLAFISLITLHTPSGNIIHWIGTEISNKIK